MKLRVEIEVREPFLPLFWPVGHPKATRFAVVIAHRRCGKTVMALQKAIAVALGPGKPNTRCAYIAPLRNQAKNVAWDYLKRMTEGVPDRTVNESELRVDFGNGARITLYGADNPDALRGGYLDFVVMDEVDQMPHGTWEYVVRPMLADRKGRAFFIGTPQGRQQLFDLYEAAPAKKEWSRHLFKASQTKILPESELEEARRSMSPEAYAQEFECSFTASVKGAFYAHLIEEAEQQGRMVRLVPDRSRMITTAWDLGTRDATAIWVLQDMPGGTIHVLDYYEATGQGIDHYADWMRYNKYLTNARHLAPHDIANTDIGIVGGLNRKQVAASLGIEFERVARPQDSRAVMDGIQAVRMLIPRMLFHRDGHRASDHKPTRSERVRSGLLALSLYRQAYNERLGALQANPVHDWTSHAADAMRVFASSPTSTLSPEADPAYRINLRQRRPETGRGYRRHA